MENSIDLQNTKNRTTHDPAIPLLDIYSKKKQSQRDASHQIHRSIICIAKWWK
jgi:hypothetical protein